MKALLNTPASACDGNPARETEARTAEKKGEMKRTSTAVIVVGLLGYVPNATAQEARTYIGGGFMVVPWGGARSTLGGPSTSFSNIGPEAINTGVLAEGGVFLNRTVAVGFEASFPFQRNPLTQEYGYFNPYRLIARYREQTFFGVMRAQTPSAGRVRLAAVGGGGFLRGDFRERTARGYFSRPGFFDPFSDERGRTVVTLAATFGAEMETIVTRHIQIVPQFRVLLIDRGSVLGGDRMASFGFKKVVYRSAITVWATF